MQVTPADIATIIFNYWTQPDTFKCSTGLVLLKPAFPTWVGNGQCGSQQGEYSLDWPPALGDNKKAHGAAQWHDPRIEDILAHTGIDVRTADCLDQQRAMWFELTTVCAACHHLLNISKNEADVVAALVDDFEYSSNRPRDKARRTAYALNWKVHFGAKSNG